MELEEFTIQVSDINDFPGVEKIQKVPRGMYLKINLIGSAQKQRGEQLRILETMYKLGKFEMINSNLRGREGYIVKDRIKKEVSQPEKGIQSILEEQKKIQNQPKWKDWFKRK